MQSFLKFSSHFVKFSCKKISKFLMIILVFILSNSSMLGADPLIKSLRAYVNNDLFSLPVVKLNTNDKLNIYFEIEAEHTPEFAIHFKYCDMNWKTSDNLFLQGTKDNATYNINVDRLPSTTEGAEYFVDESFPNNDVQFYQSGNWMFYITDSYDDQTIYEFGKFYVVENIVGLKTDIQNWRREGSVSSNNELDRVLNFKTSFSLPDSLDPFRVDHIEIVKNLEVNYSQKLTKDSFQKNKGFEWDGTKNFTFITRDLQPGNEYREVNLLDKDKYQYPNTRAQFDGIEYSRFYQLGKSDLNGSFKLMNKENQYADYLTATFEFRPPDPTSDDIFIVGSFTNWEVLPWYQMKNKNDVYSISIELKRGTYDYEYVTGAINEDSVENIDWFIFEGNFWETINKYSVFLYYKSPDKGEYDQIIGFKQVMR
jgi:hypothetical protein